MMQSSKQNSNQGATETIGFVLLIALAVVTSVFVVAAAEGGPISALSEQSENEQVKNTFSQLSSSSVSAAVGGSSSSNSVALPFANNQNPLVVEESSSIHIWSEDPDDGSTQEILEKDIGHMSYKVNQEYTMYYQNGGVWKIYDNGSVETVTAPEFHYNYRTLTLPLIKLQTSQTEYYDSITFDHKTESRAASQVAIEDEIVYIQIQGPTYRGWGHYFESHLNSNAVRYDHDNNTATMELGLGGNLLNSFENVAVMSGDINMEGNATVNGDVKTAGSVDGGNVNGDVTQTDEYNLLSLDPLIKSEIQDAETNGTKLDGDDLAGKTIDSGNYYVEEIYLESGTFTIDLSDGDVDIGVDGDITIRNDAKIEVINPSGGSNEVFLEGNMAMEEGSPQWLVENEATDSNIVYGSSDSQISIGQKSTFQGVIYAPSSTDDDSNSGSGSNTGGPSGGSGNCKTSTETFCMGSNSTVDGAVISGSAELKNSSTLNYDSDSLDEFEKVYDEYSFSRPQLSYIHTSITTVEIKEGNSS